MKNPELITNTEKDRLIGLAEREIDKVLNLVFGFPEDLADDVIFNNCQLRLKAAENAYRTTLETRFVEKYHHLISGAPDSDQLKAREKSYLIELFGPEGYQNFEPYVVRDMERLTDFATGLDGSDEEDPPIIWNQFVENIKIRVSAFRHLYKEILVKHTIAKVREERGKPAENKVAQFPAAAAS